MQPMNKQRKKPDKKIKLTDDEFIAKFESLNRNQTHMAEFLSISRTAVKKRFDRCVKKGLVKVRKNGTVIVSNAVAHASAVQEGMDEGIKQVRIMESLYSLLVTVEGSLKAIEGEMEAHKNAGGKSIKPYHLDMLIKTIRAGQGLLTDIFKIKKDLFSIEGTSAFMKAVINVMEKYDPDVQSKLYVELSRIGFGEQTHDFNEGETSSSE